jgi:hypothetical protein
MGSAREVPATGTAEPGVAPMPRQSRRRVVLAVGALGAAAILVVVALTIIPLSQPFNMTLNPTQGANPPQGTEARSWPSGAEVQFSWQTMSGGAVNFTFRDSSSHILYREYAPNGSFAFTANGEPYSFGFFSPVYYLSSNTVEISGTASSPLI